MCKACSILITKSKKVYWKVGVDSHDELQKLYVKKDKELKDNVRPPENTFARIEIVPKDGNYLNLKQKWVYQIDEQVKPSWLNKSYEKPCYDACKKWQKLVYSRINLKEAIKPIYPFKIKSPKITTRHLKLLAKWASVRASVWDSVGASVGAYNGSLYKGIKTWKYCSKVKGYPFKSAVKLWKLGLVGATDGTNWYLLGGKNVKILWKGTKKELKKYK